MAFNKELRRRKIRYRIRQKIKGNASLPRLAIFRSNKFIYCQLIDDVNNVTLATANSKEATISQKGSKVEQAKEVGKLIAERAQSANVSRVVFDRGGYLFHGRVKALSEGAKEAGLTI